jgi:hypothetical protein
MKLSKARTNLRPVTLSSLGEASDGAAFSSRGPCVRMVIGKKYSGLGLSYGYEQIKYSDLVT